MAHVDSQTPPRRGPSLTQQIFIGLALGIVVGWLVERVQPRRAAIYFRPFSQLFLRLIKMIIAPLIFATLVAGIAGAGHFKVVGRMGLRAIIYFEIVTTLALVIGLVAVNIMKPGVGVNLPMGQAVRDHRRRRRPGTRSCSTSCPSRSSTRWPRATCCRSSSSASSSAIALGMIGEKGRPVVAWCEALAETMFKFTNIVMHYAPIGVGAAIAYTVGHGGLGVLVQPGLAGRHALHRARGLRSCCVLLPVALHLQGADPQVHPRGEGAGDHRVLDDVERGGAAARDGGARAARRAAPDRRRSCCRSATASTSTARRSISRWPPSSSRRRPACSSPIGQQITMLLTLMLTSKGVAGVPRASLVILAGTLASYGLPLEGVTLILGVDELMDMARTMTNVDRQLPGHGRRRQVGRRVRRGERRGARARGRARRNLTVTPCHTD